MEWAPINSDRLPGFALFLDNQNFISCLVVYSAYTYKGGHAQLFAASFSFFYSFTNQHFTGSTAEATLHKKHAHQDLPPSFFPSSFVVRGFVLCVDGTSEIQTDEGQDDDHNGDGDGEGERHHERTEQTRNNTPVPTFSLSFSSFLFLSPWKKMRRSCQVLWSPQMP